MKEVTLKINGKSVKAEKGTTLLQAATSAGVKIPTICHHEKLEKPAEGDFSQLVAEHVGVVVG